MSAECELICRVTWWPCGSLSHMTLLCVLSKDWERRVWGSLVFGSHLWPGYGPRLPAAVEEVSCQCCLYSELPGNVASFGLGFVLQVLWWGLHRCKSLCSSGNMLLSGAIALQPDFVAKAVWTVIDRLSLAQAFHGVSGLCPARPSQAQPQFPRLQSEMGRVVSCLLPGYHEWNLWLRKPPGLPQEPSCCSRLRTQEPGQQEDCCSLAGQAAHGIPGKQSTQGTPEPQWEV